MFSKTIVLSDTFLDMPATTRCLYFTLSMLADDEGFVNNPKSIMRQCGAAEDDFKILIPREISESMLLSTIISTSRNYPCVGACTLTFARKAALTSIANAIPAICPLLLS